MRIEWVHPTWRDLVIETLIADDRARRRFLRRTGVHGVELALSTAGGRAGARRLPLIQTDADWDALADRLYELVAELEPQDLIAALAALTVAIDDLGAMPALQEAQALARTVLGRVASLWDAAGRPVAVDLLDGWLGLAGWLDPRPAAPELSVTWAELEPTRTPPLRDRAAIERFADWLVLCELLRSYEKARLEALGFGPDQVALALAFALELERHWDELAPATEDQALRAVECIGRLVPEYSELPATVARQLRRSARRETIVAPMSARDLEREFAQLGPPDVYRVLADL